MNARIRAVVSVTELQPGDVALVDRVLPLNRLDQQVEEGSTYLVGWEDDQPVGHAHIAWSGTHLRLPEIQDVFVLPERRRRGIATRLTEAAETEARARGWESISLSVSQDDNPAARLLYETLGYVDAGTDPVRVTGTIMLRGVPFEVDDTLLYLTKALSETECAHEREDTGPPCVGTVRAMSEAETLFGDAHVRRYRETSGEVGHIWKRGAKILLLTTKGRSTGEPRTAPLIYEDVDGAPVIVASKGGAAEHPGWYRNLLGDPEVTVQILGDVFQANARTATGEERDRLWAAVAQQWPDYDLYRARTAREIPVVVLERR